MTLGHYEFLLLVTDTIWQCGTWSTLDGIMACCLTALSHFLKQYWPIVSGMLLHSLGAVSLGGVQGIYHYIEKIWYVEISSPKSLASCPILVSQFTQCLLNVLTHWGRVTHICVDNLNIIGSDNGLSPGRRQAITWTNVGILLKGPLGTNFSEMLIEIHTFSFKKIHL